MRRPAVVVDASVAVKWILPEQDHEQALMVQEQYQNEQLDILAPYLLVSEVANVLWKRQSRGDIGPDTARRCFQQFLDDCPTLLDVAAVSAAALALAMAHRRPVYDYLYLALALEQRCDVITADERFFNAVNMAFPCVRLLRSCTL